MKTITYMKKISGMFSGQISYIKTFKFAKDPRRYDLPDNWCIFKLTFSQYINWFKKYYEKLPDMNICDICSEDMDDGDIYLLSHNIGDGTYEPSRAVCYECVKNHIK